MEPVGLDRVRFVAGVDVAYKGGLGYGAAVVVDLRDLSVVDAGVSVVRVSVPYMPGLLAFREVGPMVSALTRLRVRPDVVMVNGHGLAHPRGFGVATHLGVVLGVSSVGVAKKRLVGEEVGGRLFLGGREVARVIPNGRLKIYVSVGNKITLGEAVALTKRLVYKPNKLPLPVQEAHNKATMASRADSCSSDRYRR